MGRRGASWYLQPSEHFEDNVALSISWTLPFPQTVLACLWKQLWEQRSLAGAKEPEKLKEAVDGLQTCPLQKSGVRLGQDPGQIHEHISMLLWKYVFNDLPSSRA